MFTSKKLKFIICGIAVALAAGIYWYTSNLFSQVDQRNIRMEELFALSALTFLYLSVLANPLKRIFPNSRAASMFKELQPVLVTVTLGFALLHATIAFFFLLGGFAGLSFLSGKFILGIILASLSILTIAFVTGYNWMSRRFPWINNLLYIVGVLITIHALLLGADFIILSQTIPKIFFSALLILLVIEAWAFDYFLNQSNRESKRFGPVFAVCLIIISALGVYLLFPNGQLPSLSDHAGHLMPDGSMMPGMNMPGMVMTGDASKHYTVSMNASPANPKPGQDVNLTFKVYDAATGSAITDYDIVMTKIVHLVIVDGSLTYFDHIHPSLNGSELAVTTKFPKDDLYHLYLNFQPTGGTEQQIALTLPVGTGVSSVASMPASDLTKTFGDLSVALSASDGQPFTASTMNSGTQSLNFNFKNAATGEPVDDLQPYLGAFGHLVLINEKTYEYIHVHPIVSLSSDFGGPDVVFTPTSYFTTITPGTYRVFGQFNRKDQIFVADFTINIQ